MNTSKIITLLVFASILLASVPYVFAQTDDDLFVGNSERIFDAVIAPNPSRVELLTASFGVPIAVAFLTAGAGALVMTVSAGSASLAFNLSQIFESLKLARFYLLGLVRMKRKRPWGRVVDKLTGRPIPLAMVRVYSAEFKKLLDAHLTDGDGRFGALVVPGTYHVQVSRRGYLKFQSDAIKVSSENHALNVEISIFPSTEALSVSYIKKLHVLQAVKHFLRMSTPLLLVAGTIMSCIVMLVLPTSFNYLIFWLYVLLNAVQVYFIYHFKKPFGIVADFSSKEPLPLSVVRIFDADKNWLLETKVTDRRGRFGFLLFPGTYYSTCVKAGYKPYRSDSMTLKEAGLANLDIEMKKA